MYRPFVLTGYSPTKNFLDSYLPVAREIWSEDSKAVKGTLETFLLEDGSLDGEKMRSNWFPQVTADVFISHSLKDLESAQALAGWLHREFGLRPFIDSCVWARSEELLRAVDDEHCRADWDSSIFDYNKRNGSTSHVHLMLVTALTMMIDKTECAILLETPNSIAMRASDAAAAAKTKSPWILCEIAAMELVRRREPARMLKKAEERRGRLDEVIGAEGPVFLHAVSTKALTKITVDTLNTWRKEWAARGGSESALDTLYRVAPARKD